MNSLNEVFYLIGAGLFFIICEKAFPLRVQKRKYLARLFTNLVMSVFLYSTAIFTVKPLSYLGMSYANALNFGILNWLELPHAISFVLGFLFLDLSFYYWHKLNHLVPWLWRFHVVHHIDPDLDVSTSFRFHFFEVAYSMFFRFTQILIIGVPLELFVTFEMTFQIMTFFHHSNWRLPGNLDRVLNWVIVTPQMHGIHHSTIQNETHSNFSVIFSFWDRLHKTFEGKSLKTPIEIGVSGYSAPPDNTFENLIMSPFRKQKFYWSQ